MQTSLILWLHMGSGSRSALFSPDRSQRNENELHMIATQSKFSNKASDSLRTSLLKIVCVNIYVLVWSYVIRIQMMLLYLLVGWDSAALAGSSPELGIYSTNLFLGSLKLIFATLWVKLISIRGQICINYTRDCHCAVSSPCFLPSSVLTSDAVGGFKNYALLEYPNGGRWEINSQLVTQPWASTCGQETSMQNTAMAFQVSKFCDCHQLGA